MDKNQMQELEKQLDKIIIDYLNKVSSSNHNHFKKQEITNCKTQYNQCHGFGVLYEERENDYVVDEEVFLESYTRVYLIKPIMQYLLGKHGIVNEWNNFDFEIVSNREFELEKFIEFIAVLDEKRIGVRYTKESYSSNEGFAMWRDMAYKFGKAKIPGFDQLTTVDFVYSIYWADLTEEELSNINIIPPIDGITIFSKTISLNGFFEKFFSLEEYDIVIPSIKKAIKRAQGIIALKAMPQLQTNNMLLFKQAVLEDFSREKMNCLSYDFKDKENTEALDKQDQEIIEKAFFEMGRRNALIGDADFSKSFITSEYLFRTIGNDLSIDYTSVAVGYLKAVEQLLYLLYVSAFEGKPELEYWDKCRNIKLFDCKKTWQYRYDPYNPKWMQENYLHLNKTEFQAPDFGRLNNFLRYYEKMWRISEKGKEYVVKCLDDFRTYCRNFHFHKHNIESGEYETVKRIRNNTQICLYYLLGGFEFLDTSIDENKQLGIIDYRFEIMYQKIRWGRRYFEAEYSDGSKLILRYLKRGDDFEYDEAGRIKNGCMIFLKVDINNFDSKKMRQLIKDEEYVANRMLCITRNNMPLDIREVSPLKLEHQNSSDNE